MSTLAIISVSVRIVEGLAFMLSKEWQTFEGVQGAQAYLNAMRTVITLPEDKSYFKADFAITIAYDDEPDTKYIGAYLLQRNEPVSFADHISGHARHLAKAVTELEKWPTDMHDDLRAGAEFSAEVAELLE